MKYSKITRFWAFLLAMLVSAGLNAQSIGLVGEFTNWGNPPGNTPDVQMVSTGNGNYVLNNYTFTGPTALKFRQNSNWATSWGGIFPSGTAGGN